MTAFWTILECLVISYERYTLAKYMNALFNINYLIVIAQWSLNISVLTLVLANLTDTRVNTHELVTDTPNMHYLKQR